MIKNLLLILFLSVTSVAFSQIAEKSNTLTESKQETFGKTLNEVGSYPNPFSETTKISFFSTIKQNVFFEVKTVLGKSIHRQSFKVKTGENILYFHRDELVSGMYLYTLQTDNEVISKRLIVR